MIGPNSCELSDLGRRTSSVAQVGRGEHHVICESAQLTWSTTFMTSKETGFKYSDFQPVESRKKRKNKVQLERLSLLTLVQRAREELAKDDWNAQCQRPFSPLINCDSLFSSLCRIIARIFDCPYPVLIPSIMFGSRESFVVAKLSCSACLST